ncbi:MAG: preprotein translocase subunit YajC [Sphingomonadales bacterium]|jgi:preprotein translocase subunit YajC|nr:preprotein translocase subunit YajC [Sphingomonadales bacterium]
MFESPAFAATTGGAAGSGATVMFFGQFLLIGLIFYFLLIRPQQRRVKQHREMIGAVKRNDVAVTSGGLIGKVTKVDEEEVELEVAANVRVRVLRGMLQDVRPHGQKPAND